MFFFSPQASMYPIIVMGEHGCGKSTALDSILHSSKRPLMGGSTLHTGVARTVLSRESRPEQLQVTKP